ncbi:MAG: helix-turn-helix transcriptional regulator [Candidatus Aenigmarchaeota archaeon]|nr:helix-turn-helix transcriptional regulator [Candidatus Aenigmarchaeota archaeon]
MKTLFVEHSGDRQKIYRSLLIEPKKLNILSSDLAIRIVAELGSQQQCAMDLARALKQHEQKIYYHLRNLEKAGIVRQVGTENRYGMTAKIYDVVSPVVAAKLYEGGHTIENPRPIKDHDVEEFLRPFIIDGKLNALTIFGYPYSHGKYDAAAKGDAHAFDLALLLGSFLREVNFPNYMYDVDAREGDVKNNLILIGNTKSNTIIDKMNGGFQIAFDEEGNVISKKSGKTYKDPSVGVVIKCANPFSKNKKILLLYGIRTRGIRTAIMAITNKLNELVKGAEDDGSLVRIVEGLDRDGDKVIDHVEILE